MTKFTRSQVGLLVAAGLFATASSSEALAQRFSFDSANFTNSLSIAATEGSTLQLPVFVSGVTPGVAGVNFTVRVSTTSNASVQLSSATGAKDAAVNALDGFADNKLTRTGVSGGTITGNVNEYRAVIYSSAATPATVAANSPIKVATLSIPIAAGTAGQNVQIELVSAIDNMTGLLGISDAAGTSIVPGGETRPFGQVATVAIGGGSGFPITTDFANSGASGWKYTGGLPEGQPAQHPVGAAVAGQGLTITSVAQNSFGIWFHDRGDNFNPMRRPAAGQIYSVEFKAGSNRAGNNVPVLRHLISTCEDFFGNQNVIQDVNVGASPATVPENGAVKSYFGLVQVPSFADDGGTINGVYGSFDMLQFPGIGQVGGSIWLNSIVERSTDPATLTGATQVYHEVFNAADTGSFVGNDFKLTNGWGFVDFDPDASDNDNVVTIPGANKAVTYHSADARGIGFTSSGGLDIPITTASSFTLGLWETMGDITRIGGGTLVADSTKWYKVEMRVQLLGDTPAIYGPIARVRMFASSFDNFHVSSYTPFANKGDLTLPRPDADGETITAWFKFTPESNGVPLRLGADLVHHLEDYSGSGGASIYKTPTLFISEITVTEYNAP